MIEEANGRFSFGKNGAKQSPPAFFWGHPSGQKEEGPGPFMAGDRFLRFFNLIKQELDNCHGSSKYYNT